jgi:hypothetical protein
MNSHEQQAIEHERRAQERSQAGDQAGYYEEMGRAADLWRQGGNAEKARIAAAVVPPQPARPAPQPGQGDGVTFTPGGPGDGTMSAEQMRQQTLVAEQRRNEGVAFAQAGTGAGHVGQPEEIVRQGGAQLEDQLHEKSKAAPPEQLEAQAEVELERSAEQQVEKSEQEQKLAGKKAEAEQKAQERAAHADRDPAAKKGSEPAKGDRRR